jgi:hypothetical protein
VGGGRVTAKEVKLELTETRDTYSYDPASGSLALALAAFQLELPRLPKSKTANTGSYDYDYADLAEASLIILPRLAKHGLSFSSKPTVLDGRPVLISTLRHASGDSDEAIWELPPKGSPQQIGSAITYGRRYTLCAMTGVAAGGEDDDGREAEKSDHRPGDSTTWQDELYQQFVEEIANAADQDMINEIAGRVRPAFDAKRLLKYQYDKLGRQAAAKVATFPKPEPT